MPRDGQAAHPGYTFETVSWLVGEGIATNNRDLMELLYKMADKADKTWRSSYGGHRAVSGAAQGGGHSPGG